MQIPRSYRKPLLIAVFLHLALLLVMVLQLPYSHYRLPGKASPHPAIVQATAVNTQSVQNAMRAIQYREAKKQRLAARALAKLRAQAHAAEVAKQNAAKRVLRMHHEQQRLQQLHTQQMAHLAALKQQALLVQRQVTAAKKAQKKALRLAKVHQQRQKLAAIRARQAAAQKREQALLAKQKALQEKLLQQQLAGEGKTIEKLQTAALDGVVDKYKALILQAIGQQWLVPTGVNQRLHSVFLVDVGPGGVVLSVQLLQTSGNAALDHSAETAIYKASPLPVPKQPEAFDAFRHLRLMVSPKSVIHS